VKKLPKMFQGAEVVRGLGMDSAKLDTLLASKALDQFDATRELWIVVADDALGDPDASTWIKGFQDKASAIRYACAMANGNVDHRVLRVSDQTLVVATRNEL
jgi:hypothetical protein